MTRPNFSISIPGVVKRDFSVPGTFTSDDYKFSSETVSGVSRRKPKGWIPPTGYSFARKTYQRAYGVCDYQVVPGNRTRYSGVVGGSPGPFNSLNHFNSCVSEVTATSAMSTSAALAAARVKLKNGSVNLGVAYGERKATSRQLGDTAKRMADAVRALRRGEFRNAARRLGILSDPGKPRGSNWTNHWLQLQYGWKPLLSDVYGACEALTRRPMSDWNVTTTAYRSDHDQWTFYSPPQSGSIGNLVNCCSVVAERQRGVFVRIDATPVNDLTMSLTSLGITNPLLVAWELVPYSFVVDWVLPVGQWLDSLDALLGYGPAWTSISSYRKTNWVDVGLSKDYSATSWVHYNYIGTKELVNVNRTATSGVPIPAFPRFKDPRSLGHMANGLSLLAQAFGR